ncbi:MAG: RNA polymerase sigma factor RpoH [Alphaproteobacteria bacterium]|nr:RNA polymerase sigma factor RpoH [Alphaproteobacteria bacterium]
MATLGQDILDLSPDQNLSRYLQRIRQYPMLEPEEELQLARRWQEHEDPEAASSLVNSHLRLVAKIAKGFQGYGLPLSELISEGNVGMMQAVQRFDPERGFRFSTYAMWWIRASIQEYVLHSWSLVKMGTTAAQKKLFFNLRKLKAQIRATEEGDLYPENVSYISDRLGVPETEVINMNRRLGGQDQSLNMPVREEGEGEWQDWLEAAGENQEYILSEHQEMHSRRLLLDSALDGLSGRERHILSERRLSDEPATLQVLSERYGISRERVRQIEVRAFEKVQKSVRNAVIESRVNH